MNSKDTVIKPDELGLAIFKHQELPMGQAIAIEQAEISFKAGVREVIGFLDKPCPHTGGLEEQQMRAIDCQKCFDAQVKEWGLAP